MLLSKSQSAAQLLHDIVDASITPEIMRSCETEMLKMYVSNEVELFAAGAAYAGLWEGDTVLRLLLL